MTLIGMHEKREYIETALETRADVFRLTRVRC